MVLFGVLALLAWRTGGFASGAGTDCSCEIESLRNGWCERHGGWVAGVSVPSKSLHDAVDAHGHEIDASLLTCETCRAEQASEGYCTKDRMGWIGGQAYMTRLTYQLARGEWNEGLARRCEACRERGELSGWCDTCRSGWVGTVHFTDRDDQRAAAHELDRLVAANETTKRCETCALVQLADGTCPWCHITYRDGEVVPSSPSAANAPKK